MIRDLLLPETDAGVLIQVLVVGALAVAAILAARRQPEVRILAIGLTILAAAALGLRAVH